ncbi:hypothetical protein GWO43_09800, partial [candidate division KSB1 bacterium]|nr:hypothetical protein [candidate division KSB1 bacterium]NIX70854.1 hypothetical protein [candidate division KSB1 bacterium]
MSAIFLACQLLVLCTCKTTFAQSLVQTLASNSYLDWKNFTIRATGNSSLVSSKRTQKVQALERARLAAVNNLLSAVKQVRVDGNSDLKDLLIRKPALETRIRNAIKRFTIVDTRSMSDMSVEIDIDFSVKEHLLPLLLPKDTGQGKLRLSSEPLCPTCGQSWPENRPVPEGMTLIIPSEGYTNAHGKPFLGLVIDAT